MSALSSTVNQNTLAECSSGGWKPWSDLLDYWASSSRLQRLAKPKSLVLCFRLWKQQTCFCLTDCMNTIFCKSCRHGYVALTVRHGNGEAAFSSDVYPSWHTDAPKLHVCDSSCSSAEQEKIPSSLAVSNPPCCGLLSLQLELSRRDRSQQRLRSAL